MADIVDKMIVAYLRWFGHMRRREEGEPARRAIEMEVKWHKGTSRRSKRWMDCIRS